MRKFISLAFLLLPVGVVGFFVYGQSPAPGPFLPVTPSQKSPSPNSEVERKGPKDVAPRVKARTPTPAGADLPEPAQTIFFSASRGMNWLKLTNKPDGRFVYGFQPALAVELDGDNFLSQAGATFALARSARFFGDQRGTAIASQAALVLTLETIADSQDKTQRHTVAPPAALNRLSANGMLISGICELASSEKYSDLMDRATEMANYLRRQQQSDGSLLVSEGGNLLKSGSAEYDAEHAGLALQGIIRSQKVQPAAWKLDLLTKARAHYHSWWQTNKNVATVCSHTPAYVEAYLLTNDKAFADTVFAMNDWLVGLQHDGEFEGARKHWLGGFPGSRFAKTESAAPDVRSATAGESLAEACRLAKHLGDVPRLQRYERALVLNLHFLMSLQYSGARTQHFVEAFRPAIVGAFHASHQDGNLRIDYTQHAVSAMVQYLDKVVDVTKR